MFQIMRYNPFKRSTKTGGTLSCTWCYSDKLKFVETYPPDREVWQCKICKKKLTYITTPMAVDDPARMQHKSEHPYAHHKRGLGRYIPFNMGFKNPRGQDGMDISKKFKMFGVKIPIIGKK